MGLIGSELLPKNGTTDLVPIGRVTSGTACSLTEETVW